ncbi:MAG: ligase-associated DNA damage response endonuclease PdeM [Balneolales bacterium]
MPNSKYLYIAGEWLELLPEKAIYWSDKKILIIADTHFGKVGTFRQAGIPIPHKLACSNFDKLNHLLNQKLVERCIVLGDLFHSKMNGQWNILNDWLKQYPDISFELVMGNHDILEVNWYEETGILVHKKFLIEPPFYLVHDPEHYTNSHGYYGLCGHVHPGVKLTGKAQRSVRLPCFYFGSKYSILPAFGAFTGFVNMLTKKDDRVFVIAENQIIKV